MATQTDVNNAVNKVINELTSPVKKAMPNGSYLGECTVPAVYYVEALTGVTAPPMADDSAQGWGLSFPAVLAPHFTHERFEPGKAYPKGTLLLWNSPHIAIVVNPPVGNSVEVFEQNADPDGSSCHLASRVIDNSFHTCTYALVPVVTAETPPPPPPPAPAEPKTNNVTPVNYDGNEVTIQPGWGLSNAAAAAGYPDANQPVRWEAIASLNGSGDWQVFNAGLKAGERIKVGKYEAPVAPPSPPAAPAPVKPANTTYTKWTGPTDFVTNKNPTHKWQLDFNTYPEAKSAVDLPEGAAFEVYGKAQRTDLDHPVYLMNQADFGNADTTGAPNNNCGINIVDLSPAAAPVQPSTPAPAANTAEGEKVPVNVIPTDPNKWQTTYTKFLGPVTYIANETTVVHDLAGLKADAQLLKEQAIVMAGKFEKDGVTYLRSVNSVNNGSWYGITENEVASESDVKDDNLMDDVLSNTTKIKQELGNLSNKEKMIVKAASVDGLISRIFHRNKK